MFYSFFFYVGILCKFWTWYCTLGLGFFFCWTKKFFVVCLSLWLSFLQRVILYRRSIQLNNFLRVEFEERYLTKSLINNGSSFKQKIWFFWKSNVEIWEPCQITESSLTHNCYKFQKVIENPKKNLWTLLATNKKSYMTRSIIAMSSSQIFFLTPSNVVSSYEISRYSTGLCFLAAWSEVGPKTSQTSAKKYISALLEAI